MSDGRRYTVKEAAQLSGVQEHRLRRWEAAGFVRAARTSGGGARRGHRRYDEHSLKRIVVLKLLWQSGRVRFRDLGCIADSLEGRAPDAVTRT